MQIIPGLLSLIASYLFGSIPSGFLLVRVLTGRDLRKEHSGRTGGTNVMRVLGFWAGLVTALFDVFKGTASVWLAAALTGNQPWFEVAAGLLAILGHNYSIFLADRINGRIRLRGGAGGSPTVGAAMGLWPPSALIIIPIGMLILFGLGYASVATMSVGFMSVLIFLFRAVFLDQPWAYAAFGVLAEGLLILALLPNIRRILQGTERVVGWRAKARSKAAEDEAG
ncbi:MAG: glycerol-3-phosphate acyltransferase [Anaerolineales bacterium]